MSFARRSVTLVAVLAVALVPGAATLGGAAAAPAANDDARGVLDPRPRTWSKDVPPGPLTSPGPFKGVDGRSHEHSPLLVPGRHGTFYFGHELDGACGYGPMFTQGMRRMAKLARLIQNSGRRVVWTIAPNKSAVNKHDLRRARLPHGRCDRMGIEQQDRVLDNFRDPNYLTVRRKLADLASPKRPLYWKIDTHWTRLSTVQWAKSLAERLNPRIAALQRYRPGRETILTDMSSLGILGTVHETGPARFPKTKVRVKPAPGSVAYDPDVLSPEYVWNSKPQRRTIAGRTVLIGDSFSYRGLDGLMPLFRHGHFVWIGDTSIPTMIKAISKADTVVLQVVQRWLPISPLVQRSFRHAVRQELKSGTPRR